VTDRPRYRLLIESTGHDGPPVEIRLRHVLKGLLRGWGFRCKSIEEVKPANNPPDGRRDPGATGATLEGKAS
jgi:hypothetical protein